MFIFADKTINIDGKKSQEHEKLTMESTTKTYQKARDKLEKTIKNYRQVI